MPTPAQRFEREGWEFNLSSTAAKFTPEMTEELVARTLEAVRGCAGEPLRRSRHAVTYRVHLRAAETWDRRVIYIKLFDAPGGFVALKERFRGSRAVNMGRMLGELREAGFCVPSLLLLGRERGGGRSLAVTTAAEGDSLVEIIARSGVGAVESKRALLHALGGEVARLHRAGFIHGDLTPHNIFVGGGGRPRFIFIDHDRTRRAAALGRRRRQLRNLVQFGRFDLDGVTRTDRLRVFRAWADALELAGRRPTMRRVLKMLAARQAGIARAREKGRGHDLRTRDPMP